VTSTFFSVSGSWDEAYAKELENFKHNGDEGEVWFGEVRGTSMTRYSH